MSKIDKLKPNGERRLLISLSGGETSGFMALWLLAFTRKHWDDIVVIFANTGQENEATLAFVHLLETYYNVRIVWVEAKVHFGARKACTHEVVDYTTASRNGEPFEEVIKKYGIPNASWPHCTRELKERPIHSYVRNELGWTKGSYATAIGIREDEMDRMSARANSEGWVYPLVGLRPMTKPLVNSFWQSQPERLNLKGYQGNCKWCWKKTLRKHYTLVAEDASTYDFPKRMERLYGGSEHNIEKAEREYSSAAIRAQTI